MLKRLLTCCICIISLLVICSGCTKDDDTVCTAEDVKILLSQYLSQNYDSCADSYLQISYNNMSAEEQQEMLALMQNVEIIDVEDNGDLSFNVTLSVPSAESMLTSALDDKGFISDFENANLSTEENVHAVVVEKYLTSLLQQGVIKTEEKSISVSIVGDEFKLASDIDIVKLLENFIKFDGVGFVQSQLNSEVSDESLNTVSSAEFISVDSNKVFMFQQSGARFLVHDIYVLQGSDAVKGVHNLSAANANIATNDNAYLIQYTVKNLSNVDAQVSDCFKLMNADGMLLENSGAYVTGLTQIGVVATGEEVELSTFLVGGDDATIVWYSAEDTSGSYVLNIVQ